MAKARGAPDAERSARRVRAGGPGKRTGGDTGTAPWADLTTVVKIAGVEAKGEEGTGLHRLRHTYAGDLIRQGVDIYVVSRLLGQSSVRVTEMYYAHLRKETLETARTALNGLSPQDPRPRLAPVA